MYLWFYFISFKFQSGKRFFSSIRFSSPHTNHVILQQNTEELGKRLCLVSASKWILKVEFATAFLPALFEMSNAVKPGQEHGITVQNSITFLQNEKFLSQVSSTLRGGMHGVFPICTWSLKIFGVTFPKFLLKCAACTTKMLGFHLNCSFHNSCLKQGHNILKIPEEISELKH